MFVALGLTGAAGLWAFIVLLRQLVLHLSTQ